MNMAGDRRYLNGLILVLLGMLACAGPILGKPYKFDPGKRMGFAAMVPASLGEWQRISVKDSEQLQEDMGINELYQALYSHPILGRVALTLEYTSDSRREYELHYPDICHGIRGDRVVVHPPAQLELSDGGSINAASMDWQQANGGHSAVAAYWYVTPEGITIDSMNLKIKQALAGIFSKPEEAVMVRFDAFYDRQASVRSHADLIAAIRAFNRDLESGIDSRANNLFYKFIKMEEI